jgi:hypothetical protein
MQAAQSAPQQEAQETTTQTKVEAAKGDQQAAHRLARMQDADAAQPVEAAASRPVQGGNGINIVA